MFTIPSMRVLVTGSQGYIGAVLVPMLVVAGHDVVGLDTCYYENSPFGVKRLPEPELRMDVRDVGQRDLENVDAVIHLAALSNDPVGGLSPKTTLEINYMATVALAKVARNAGVRRFAFSSSCSLYGGSSGEIVDEGADLAPLTPYAESKVLAENDLIEMATDDFSPIVLRNATAYGLSPSLRCDLVVNNLTGHAVTRGKVLMTSDGTPWRPLVHVRDICRVFGEVLVAPRDLIHAQAFNVGTTTENYQIREVAELVAEGVSGSSVAFGDAVSPDIRNYRVDCSKLAETLPSATPTITVAEGIRELRDAFIDMGLDRRGLDHDYIRLSLLTELRRQGKLDESLVWTDGSD